MSFLSYSIFLERRGKSSAIHPASSNDWLSGLLINVSEFGLEFVWRFEQKKIYWINQKG